MNLYLKYKGMNGVEVEVKTLEWKKMGKAYYGCLNGVWLYVTSKQGDRGYLLDFKMKAGDDSSLGYYKDLRSAKRFSQKHFEGFITNFVTPRKRSGGKG